jgi:alpha-N-arabinofuranosidase
MAQGARVSGNLFHDNGEDIFVEVDHGPFLIDNNLLLSSLSLRDNSQGGAYAHNLFAGTIDRNPYDSRQTPFLKPHSTEVAGLHDNPIGDNRFYNNVFFVRGADLSQYDRGPLPSWMDGNVFLKGAKPSKYDKDPIVKPDFDPAIKLVEGSGSSYLEMTFSPSWSLRPVRQLITTKLLGRAAIPNLPYEQPDGQPLSINTDYFGRSRDKTNPTPGPFENPGLGDLKLKVW